VRAPRPVRLIAVGTTPEEWADAEIDRRLTMQLAQTDTFKLIVTVLVALAGGFLAAALQVAFDGGLVPSIALFVLCGVATVVVFVQDDLRLPEAVEVISNATGDDEAIMAQLRFAAVTASNYNAGSITRMRRCAYTQAGLAVASAAGTMVWLMARG